MSAETVTGKNVYENLCRFSQERDYYLFFVMKVPAYRPQLSIYTITIAMRGLWIKQQLVYSDILKKKNSRTILFVKDYCCRKMK